MNLIEVNNLSVSFLINNTVLKAVNSVSFNIKKGEIVAIVGESGAGKSITVHSILQLLNHNKNIIQSGSIKYNDQEIINSDNYFLQKLRGNSVSMIFQEPMSSLNPLHTIEKQISESLILHNDISKEKAKSKVLNLLNLVRINNAENRLSAYPHELSGGERQRVMIAMALANEPDLLIADEPTTALDVTIQAQILSLLKELVITDKMSLLLVTHDLTIVKNIADRIIVMKDGEIVESGLTDEIFKKPKHNYTVNLLNSEPKGIPLVPKKNQKNILEITNLKVYFPLKKNILFKTKSYIKAVDGISFDLKKGHTLGIVGESGSGKTTLGMAILRLINSDGTIIFSNESIHDKKNKYLRPLRKKIQIVFQDSFSSLNPRFTIKEIIAEGLKVHKIVNNNAELDKLISRILEEVELDPDIKSRYPHEFSGGQRQRISIARAMVLKPELLILDEPTSSLDLTIQSQIIKLLLDLQYRHKLSYIFISHDLRVIKALSHEIIVLKEGKIVEYDTTESILNNPKEQYTKSLINAAFNIKYL